MDILNDMSGLYIFLNFVFDKLRMFLFDVNYLTHSRFNESRTHQCNADKLGTATK